MGLKRGDKYRQTKPGLGTQALFLKSVIYLISNILFFRTLLPAFKM
ncbi:hypothetical protein JGI24_01254 [Candidatus Kryptobacter tengchongensis]|uniref:Uncharacterized protein n=1 Tax=Kryptobacter tengchongensis TaxID=1643429 RepID=A0A656D8N0_KRYT1|nr:hypothetical protein JGI24_01254 [Candidatus Kryptobacter tengchongensis]